MKSDQSVQFSLGTVRITETERIPGGAADAPDRLRISFELDSADDLRVFSSFRLSDAKGNPLSRMGRMTSKGAI